MYRRFADWTMEHAVLFAGVPCEALLETTANAIIHRDATLHGPVLVKAFASGIEVVSLGGLHGLTPDDLLNGVSLPRTRPCSTGSSPTVSPAARDPD